MQTLPTAVDNGEVEFEDFYESTLSQPLGTGDVDIYPESLPVSQSGFLVIDPEGDAPEVIYYNVTGAGYVRCPSAADGQGRGVFNTNVSDWESGTKIGMYTTAAMLEAIVTGKAMRDNFLQGRHYQSGNDDGWQGTGESFTLGTFGTDWSASSRVLKLGVVSGNATARYSAGMRFKFDQATPGTIMGKINKVEANYIYVLIQNGQTPVDEAVSNSFYSTQYSPFGFDALTGDGWEEIGRGEFTADGNTITVSSLPYRRHLKVIISPNGQTNSLTPCIRFNGDTGNNYHFRRSQNGGAEVLSGANGRIAFHDADWPNSERLDLIIDNKPTRTKTVQWTGITAVSAAASAPTRVEGAAGWFNNANAISSITLYAEGTGLFNAGSQIIILGKN